MKRIFLLIAMFTMVNCYCQQKAFKVEVFGSGQRVILIPGYACSGNVWSALVENLKQNYQLHVLTLAGFAGVPAIDTPVLKTVKNDLLQYVKDNHLNKPVLIGQGLGAFISLWACSDDPASFSKVLCIDGVPFIAAMYNPLVTAADVKKSLAYNPEALSNNMRNIYYQAMLGIVSDPANTKKIITWKMESDKKTLASTLSEISTTDLRKEITKINIPVLILGSTYGTKETSLKILNDQYSLLPNKVVIVKPGKFSVIYDAPLWFREQVKNFLVNGLTN
ncbi:MAG: alpha/beta hydrolase [Bacteroidota bacterium]|nr:alpha/beta hydrolase [Bacteroidota bacterium]